MIVNESRCIFCNHSFEHEKKILQNVQNFIPLMSVLTTLSYRKAGDPMCSAFALIIYSNNRCWRYPLICKAAAVRWCVYSTSPPVANLLIFKVVFYQHVRRVPRRLDSQSRACWSHSGPQRKTDAFLTHTVKNRKKKSMRTDRLSLTHLCIRAFRRVCVSARACQSGARVFERSQTPVLHKWPPRSPDVSM